VNKQELPNRKADTPSFPEWHTRGACFGSEAACFFPPETPVSEDRAVIDAKRYFCDHCPVLVTCLEYALLNGTVGIWAGTTTYQRDQLRRKRNRVKCPICLNTKLIRVELQALCLGCGMSWDRDGKASSETETNRKA
jgi:transcription factor WhiB